MSHEALDDEQASVLRLLTDCLLTDKGFRIDYQIIRNGRLVVRIFVPAKAIDTARTRLKDINTTRKRHEKVTLALQGPIGLDPYFPHYNPHSYYDDDDDDSDGGSSVCVSWTGDDGNKYCRTVVLSCNKGRVV